MIIGLLIVGAVIVYTLYRSGNDISYAVGEYEYLEQADTSNSHYLITFLLILLCIVLAFLL